MQMIAAQHGRYLFKVDIEHGSNILLRISKFFCTKFGVLEANRMQEPMAAGGAPLCTEDILKHELFGNNGTDIFVLPF